MVRYIEAQTPLKFTALARYPDYHPEFDGGKPGGRSLDPGLFDVERARRVEEELRRSPVFGMTAMSVTEATDWGVFSKPLKLPFKLLGERYAKGFVCYGGALVGRLLKALLDRGIEPMLEHAARELVVEEGRVVGVRVEQAGKEMLHPARNAASSSRRGGFEWNTRARRAVPRRPAHAPEQPARQRGRRPQDGHGASAPTSRT